jgi:hypothetical protein
MCFAVDENDLHVDDRVAPQDAARRRTPDPLLDRRDVLPGDDASRASAWGR